MFSMIRDSGREKGKTKACFAVGTIHCRSFLGNGLYWGQEKIEDSPQGIRIGLPLGFIGSGCVTR